MALVVKDGNGTSQTLPLYGSAYSYGGVTFTPVAAPTDWLIIQGSASTIVRLKRITIGGFSTSAGSLIMCLRKASDAGTIGSGVLTGITACPHDSTASAATAVVSTVGTANYTTVPTVVGVFVRSERMFFNVVTTGASQKVVWDFTTRGDEPPTLRASTQYLCINSQGGTLPAGTKLDWSVELEESTV